MELRPLTDDALLARLSALVRDETACMASVIEHLMEVERREIVLDRGYPSLFVYCVKELNYSEAAAYYRIRAARAAQKFPEILEGLRAGRLHLEAVVRLYPHLTSENVPMVLERASGASKREVLKIAADLGAETPPKPDIIRPLRAPPPPPARPSAPEPAAAAELIPSPRRLHFSFEADDELVERLRKRLRHKHPLGRLEDLFKEAARALLHRFERTVHAPGAPARPKTLSSRRVPAAIRRQVWQRDEGRCAFVSPDGRRCESRDFLELDHITPWADGGRSDSAENIRLLCRPHNQRLARRRFGPRPRKEGP